MNDTKLKIGPFELNSRLILGTGKYPDFEIMRAAHEASGTEMITVAVGRVDFSNPAQKTILDHIDRSKYILLPNTAGAYNTEDACRIARMGRALGLGDLVKLEVLGDPKTLLPDTEALLRATEILVKEGFLVMPYTNDDPIMARKLAKLDIHTVFDLLYHLPFRYEDRRLVSPAARVQVGETLTVIGHISAVTNIFTKNGKRLQTATLTDDSGTLPVIWFNQMYLSRVFETGDVVSLYGKVDFFNRKPTLISHSY